MRGTTRASRWCLKHGRMVASLGRRARVVLFWKYACPVTLRRVAWNARKKQMLWLQAAGSSLRARDGGRERQWKAAPGKTAWVLNFVILGSFRGRPAAGCGGGGLLVSRNVFWRCLSISPIPHPHPSRPPSPFPSRRVGTEHPAHFCYVLTGRDTISRGTRFPVVFPLFINNSTSP